MTGFAAFLRKELAEIIRTWRLWVIPGMLVFFGVTSPVIAAITPALVESMVSSQPGVVIIIPPPTALDAGALFLENLNQFVLIAVVITGAGVISGERGSGTAILALTKPLSRGAFVVAKIVSQLALLGAGAAVGTVACAAVIALVFQGVDTVGLLAAVAIWLLYASVLVVAMTLFSAAFRSRGAAAGVGLAFYFVTLLLSSWGPAARYGFVGLWPAMRDAIMREPASLAWPATTAAAALVIGTIVAIRIFERQEL